MTIVTTEKKLDFAEVFEQDDNILHNSNMLNLVSATKNINETLDDLRAEIERLEALKVEIREFASDSKNLQNTTKVQTLFGKVSNPDFVNNKKHKRW